MKFNITGADKESGDDVDTEIVADSPEAAEAEAGKRGIMVAAIKPLPDNGSDAIALIDEPPPAPSSHASAAGRSSITVNASNPGDTAHSGDGTSAIHQQPNMAGAKMEYHVVLNQSLYLLESAVNKYIRDGWEPLGGLTVGVSNNALQYFQALVKRK